MKKDSKFIKYLENHVWASYTVAICAGVLLYFALNHIPAVFRLIGKIYSLFSSVVIGCVIAYILNPMMKLFEKQLKKIKPDFNWRWLAILITLFVMFVLLFVLLILLIPSLVESFSSIFANVNKYLNSQDNIIYQMEMLAMRFGIDISKVGDSLNQLIRDFANNLPSYIAKLISTSYQFGTGMINVVIGFILAIYFLNDKEKIKKELMNIRRILFYDEKFDERTQFFRRCNDILTRYIWCTLLEAIGVGLINAVLMLVFRMPYVPLISVVVALTNMLPTFGPIIGGVIGAFILLSVKPIHALIFVAITVVLQIIDGYIVKPKLFGNTLGIPAVIVLIAIVVGGKLFGVVGILLAIPFAGIVTLLYNEVLLPRIAKN